MAKILLREISYLDPFFRVYPCQNNICGRTVSGGLLPCLDASVPSSVLHCFGFVKILALQSDVVKCPKHLPNHDPLETGIVFWKAVQIAPIT